MSTINVSIGAAAEWVGARVWPQEDKAGVQKYNALVWGFNLTTAVLVVAVAAAIFSSSAVAVGFLVLAGLIRYAAEQELEKYLLPPERTWVDSTVRDLWTKMSEETKEKMVLKKVELGEDVSQSWNIDQVIIFGFPVWKMPLPTRG